MQMDLWIWRVWYISRRIECEDSASFEKTVPGASNRFITDVSNCQAVALLTNYNSKSARLLSQSGWLLAHETSRVTLIVCRYPSYPAETAPRRYNRLSDPNSISTVRRLERCT